MWTTVHVLSPCLPCFDALFLFLHLHASAEDSARRPCQNTICADGAFHVPIEGRNRTVAQVLDCSAEGHGFDPSHGGRVSMEVKRQRLVYCALPVHTKEQTTWGPPLQQPHNHIVVSGLKLQMLLLYAPNINNKH